MKRHVIVLILFLVAAPVLGQVNNIQKFYVGTFTSGSSEGIYLCNLNTETGEISLNQTFKGVDNPSFLKLSPDRKNLYVVSRATPMVEKEGGFVIAYKLKGNGELQFLNKQVSNGSDPCHVDVSGDGKYVAIATYAGGTISLYSTNDDGSLNEAKSIIINKGSGPNEARQKKPHAHSIKFSPFEKMVFSADLGTDQLNIYKLENGLISAEQPFVKLEGGAGPRHFEFHPDGKVIYVINELNSTISALKKEKDKWEVFQNISTLPENFDGENYCADIHISSDGKYLYGSNRGHNSIAAFAVNSENQNLKSVGTVSVEGDWPRNFGLAPGGNWMLVANQNSNTITVFKINRDTGIPEFTGKKIDLPSPVCVEFL